MREDIFFEIHQDLPREGPGRDKYTGKAFNILPSLGKPRILDVGCGPGGPTVKLANLSQGQIIGIDTHQPYLKKLQRKIERANLAGNISAIKASMFNFPFKDESFDIVWAEGSIYIIGFPQGLREWQRLIRPRGYLVVHEMTWLQPDPPEEINRYWQEMYPGICTIEENIKHIANGGYLMIDYFPLPEDAWWIEYYGPLEERIQKLREKYRADDEALRVLDEEQREIEMFKKYNHWYGSVFFIMQKQ
jgi:ubiquinone/menaquinone biosynthesis C-methylase UbiE